MQKINSSEENSYYKCSGENTVDMKDRLKQAGKHGQEQVKEKELLPLPVLVQVTAHPDLLFINFSPFSQMERTQLLAGDQSSAISSKP